jgi:hypothetical protein
VDDQELLKRLEREIARDLAPVRPLAAPGVRALWLPAAWVVLVGLGWLVLGPRPDIGVLGAWRSMGFSALEVVCCAVLLFLALRRSIPAMAGSPSAGLWWAAGALLVHVTVSWATLERSALAPAAGHEWSEGLICLSAITILSLPLLGLGAVLLRRGLLARALPAFLLTGLASGLAAEALWRLHCPYSNWGHVLVFHTGAFVLPLLVAWAAARLGDRRAMMGLHD